MRARLRRPDFAIAKDPVPVLELRIAEPEGKHRVREWRCGHDESRLHPDDHRAIGAAFKITGIELDHSKEAAAFRPRT